jgi:hydrogenase maturation protein HypF
MDVKRRRIGCRGFVQGVGFRPTVYRLAVAAGLSGWVLNGPDGVVLEVEGPGEAVESFSDRLRASLPPMARLDELTEREVPPLGGEGFRIVESERGPRQSALVPPDAALCADCRLDMEEPGNRRHRFPFTTCTNCGPRFTLARSLPYDRERTSMACFPLCPECRREYEDPGDRRFHAEPVSCPACGPRLWLTNEAGRTEAEGQAALERVRSA